MDKDIFRRKYTGQGMVAMKSDYVLVPSDDLKNARTVVKNMGVHIAETIGEGEAYLLEGSTCLLPAPRDSSMSTEPIVGLRLDSETQKGLAKLAKLLHLPLD